MSEFAARRMLRVSIDGVEFAFRPISLRRCLADNLLDPASYLLSITAAEGLNVTDHERRVAEVGDERAFETVLICDASVNPKITPTDPGPDSDAVWIELFTEKQRAQLLTELSKYSRLQPGDVEVLAPFRDTADADDPSGAIPDNAGGAG